MMKHFITALFFLASSSIVDAQTRINTTMIVDSVQREFIISKPSGTVPSGGYLLVFMFHSSGGDGEKFYDASGCKEKGEAEKFVTVFPSSLEYFFYNDSSKLVKTTKWKNGEALSELGPGQYMKDDIHFVRVMLDTIQKTLPIDQKRIYASGFSNGVGFVSKLAVDMSDIFAAISCAGDSLKKDFCSTQRQRQ